MYSLPLKAYLTSAGKLHYWLWSDRFFEDRLDPFFPGAVVKRQMVAKHLYVLHREEALAR